MMYDYLKKIPKKEYSQWANEFYNEKSSEFPQHSKQDFDESFNDWVENLIGDYNGTRVIQHYELTLATRDFFNKVIKRDRDKLVETYPEAFI